MRIALDRLACTCRPPMSLVGRHYSVFQRTEILAGFVFGFPKEPAFSFHELIARSGHDCPHFGDSSLNFRNQVIPLELASCAALHYVVDLGAAQQLKLLADRHDFPRTTQQSLQVANRVVGVVVFTMVVSSD